MELSIIDNLEMESYLIYTYLLTISLVYISQLYIFVQPNILVSTKIYNYFDNITLQTNEMTYVFIQAFVFFKLLDFLGMIFNYISKLKSGIYSDFKISYYPNESADSDDSYIFDSSDSSDLSNDSDISSISSISSDSCETTEIDDTDELPDQP